MVNDNAKDTGQRKKRSDKDACLNNLKLNLNLTCSSTKDRTARSHSRTKGVQHTPHKKHREKLLQGSLENISSNPLGEFNPEESSLRRSRSLAISREDVFTSLHIPSTTPHRRSQLIPRAKLIDRTNTKDRCLQKGRSHEILPISECILLKRKPSATSETTASLQNLHKPQNRQGSVTQIHRPEAAESPFIQVNSFPVRIRSEIDSLDSNYTNKTACNSVSRISHDLTYSDSDIGLSLPNYYPDSKCDTDASLTDNVSIKEDKIDENVRTNKSASPKESVQKHDNALDSIPYDENILLSKNTPLYDSLGEYSYCNKFKPRTIRGNTPYYREKEKYYSSKPRSLPSYVPSTVTYDSDSTISECNLKYYEPGNAIKEETNKFEYIESDTNFDEIKLTNDNIKLVHRDRVTENVIYDSKSECSNVEANPIYDEISNCSHVKRIDDTYDLKDSENYTDSEAIKSYQSLPELSVNETIIVPNKQTIKTFVKVQAADEVKEDDTTSSDEYKTIVSIDTDKQSSCFSSQESKKHSHNYLREFLESQKGSKGPLQNFLSKKISRAFGDKTSKNNANKSTNLSDHQFYSLPDITVSKNLRRCEKIDRKLRKCDNLKVAKNPRSDTTNRFIVNIGRHFDVTAQSNIPVDFEVKISKIPKSHKSKHKSKSDGKGFTVEKERTFLDAVKNLKETLNGIDENQNITKPAIVGVKTKLGKNEELKNTDIKPKTESVQILDNKNNYKNSSLSHNKSKENTKMETEMQSIDKEYQEKLGTVRNYWDKMINEAAEKSKNEVKSQETDDKEGTYKCKIVEVQTKVDEVKKMFEERDEKPVDKQQGKVQLAKQMFETKPKTEKIGRVSNYIKECKELFENPYFEKDHSNQFESLNPNIVEIIEKEERHLKMVDDGKADNKAGNKKQHKPVVKSKSVTVDPEFDHVRYKIMKSDVFQKKIFANCEKESQFDGLMQYLQDYSFQELLIDNNIVIIEPIRSNVKYEPHKLKTPRNVTQLLHKTNNANDTKDAGLRRHFFYHPIRINREVNDDELPNPDTVKQVRQFFEGGLKRWQSSKDLDAITKKDVQYTSSDPDKDHCSATDTNSNASTMSDYGSNENVFESLDDMCCETQYVSEDILQKIRERGTSITYYGGRVLDKHSGKTSLTKIIMEEIRKNQKSGDCNCKRRDNTKSVTFATEASDDETDETREIYQGIKFKLLKSNSCSSRLELVGTKNLSDYRNKFLNKQKRLIDEHNKKTRDEEVNSENSFTEVTTINLINTKAIKNSINNDKEIKQSIEENGINAAPVDKNSLNENIKHRRNSDQSPKIISEEIKMPTKKTTRWGEKSDDNNHLLINNIKRSQNINFDFNLRKVSIKPETVNDMEFEQYEIADS